MGCESRRMASRKMQPNGLELSCPAEAGKRPLIVAQAGGPGAPPYGPARRVSFSELLGAHDFHDGGPLLPAVQYRDGPEHEGQLECFRDELAVVGGNKLRPLDPPASDLANKRGGVTIDLLP